MFENHFLNRFNLHCSEHPSQEVTHFCTDSQCRENCLICPDCFNRNESRRKHYEH